MATIIDCPACGRKLRVPDELFRQLVRCPTCGESFTAVEGHGVPEETYAREYYTAHPPGPAPEARRTPGPDTAPYEHPRERPELRYDPQGRPGKPAKVQAIGFMFLFGGIFALLLGFGMYIGAISGKCCLFPGGSYSLLLGLLAIIKGSNLLGESAHKMFPPRAIAVMQLVNILNLDVANLVLGIITLAFLNEPEVKRYFLPGRHPETATGAGPDRDRHPSDY